LVIEKLELKKNIKQISYLLATSVTRKIKKFHRSCQGESCYVVGDGVSLKSMDFNHLPSKKSILCNFSLFHKNIKILNPIIYNCPAPFLFRPKFGNYSRAQIDLLEGIKTHISEYSRLLNLYSFYHLSNYPFISRKRNFFFPLNLPITSSMSNEEKTFFQNQPIINAFQASVMLAIYFGFSDIYLLGCDYTHTNSRSHHWYEKGNGVRDKHNNYEIDFLTKVKKLVNISTITLSGSSPVINSITYEDFTGFKLKYEENDKLTSKTILDTLDIYSGNNIY
jgi:hypothetical protein